MTAQQYRMKILEILYHERAQGPLRKFYSEDLFQRLDVTKDEVWHEIVYLKEKGFIESRDRKVGTRIFCTLNITANGIDFFEAHAAGDRTADFGFLPKVAGPIGDWNTEAIRQLLAVAFSDNELSALCFDHFNSVYQDFGTGMGKRDKIHRLLEYCVNHAQVEVLLAFIRERNPNQYARFEGQLKR